MGAARVRSLAANTLLALLAWIAGTALILAHAPGARAEAPGAITEFSIPTGGAPDGIATGPDDSLWFTEYGLGFGESISRITAAGVLTQFSIPGGGVGARFITQGSDGNMWFTEYAAGEIGRVTQSGQFTQFALPGNAGPNGIAAGSDGNIWFTETNADAIGRITPSGEVATFAVPAAGAGPVGIAQGPEGDMWFTEYGFGAGERLGRITTTGQITEFPLPDAKSAPYDIADGPEGEMWFTENAHDAIGRIDPASGQITTFPIPAERARPLVIAPGIDGNMWFTEYAEGAGQTIGRISGSGQISEFQTPTGESGPWGIAPAPDGNVWFTEYSKGRIGRIGTGAGAVQIAAPTITGDREASVPQTCNAGSFASLFSQQPLATFYGFDGYQWSLEGAIVGTGPTFTPTFAEEGHKLYCVQTVTYPLPTLLSDTATSAGETVIAPPPTLAHLRISPSLWSEGKEPLITTGSGKHRHRRRVPAGTFVSFSMNESAPVAFDFDQRVAGRREEGACEAPNRENAKHRHCLRTVTAAELLLTGQMGENHVYFEGAITSKRKLAPGKYTLVLASANTTGSARPVSVPFTVTR